MDVKNPLFLVCVVQHSDEALRLYRYCGRERLRVVDLVFEDASATDVQLMVEQFRKEGFEESTT